MKAHNVRVYLRTRGLLALGDHHCLFPNLAIDEQGYSSVQLCSVSIKYQSQVGLCIKRSYHPIVFSYGIYQWRRQRFFSAGAMGVLGVLPRVL